MLNIHLRLILGVAACLWAPAASAAGTVAEKEKTYAIAGRTGLELYQSIGERGPVVGKGIRTIAHTNFKLTWRRDYAPKNGACTLVSAVPKLIITYTLPKPAGPLAPETRRRWAVFIDGIRKHEHVHGQHIREMVTEIETNTIGLSVPDDPGCKKIRQAIVAPLKAASDTQRIRSREFDHVEMGEGGNIRNLILGLVAD